MSEFVYYNAALDMEV